MAGVREGLVVRFFPRFLVTVALLLAVGVIIYRFPEWMFCLVVAALIGIGQNEFFGMVDKKGVFVYRYFGIIAGILVPVVIFLGSGEAEVKNLEPLLIVGASLFAFTLQFTRRDNGRDHLLSVALTLFSLFYICWFFSFILKLRLMENGANLVAFLILVTKSADIGAYLVGSMAGRTGLIPRISPKKTIEGTFGGVVLSVVIAMVLGPYLTGFHIWHLVVLGCVLAVFGQIGDLAESLIKRDCGVKDSGTYLPGIGGVMDLIDSLLFTAPFFFFYVTTF